MKQRIADPTPRENPPMDETTPAGTPEDVPEPARRLAEEEGLPLADAYLRFLHRERQRAAEERERQRQAAARSSGPLAGERAEPQPEQEAFRRAFEKALW